MRKLFIYYSLTGNGDEVAIYLRKKGYDIRKIVTSEILPRTSFFRILSGGFKALINYKDKLIDFDNEIDDYDEVVIGSPIWNNRLSSPINTVLEELNLNNKKISFVLYSGSGRANHAKNMINNRYGDCKIICLKEPKNDKEELKKIF